MNKITNKDLIEFLNDTNVRTRSDGERYILVNSDLATALEKFAEKLIKQKEATIVEQHNHTRKHQLNKLSCGFGKK